MRRADLLVTTHFHASEVQAIAERLDKPWAVVSLRTDIFAEIARMLPKQPVYFVVTDERYARKLERVFGSTAGLPNFRALVLGRDDLGAIPDGAPVYVTALARTRVSDARLLERVMPEPRSFSGASARELLRFVVEANMRALGVLDRG